MPVPNERALAALLGAGIGATAGYVEDEEPGATLGALTGAAVGGGGRALHENLMNAKLSPDSPLSSLLSSYQGSWQPGSGRGPVMPRSSGLPADHPFLQRRASDETVREILGSAPALDNPSLALLVQSFKR